MSPSHNSPFYGVIVDVYQDSVKGNVSLGNKNTPCTPIKQSAVLTLELLQLIKQLRPTNGLIGEV